MLGANGQLLAITGERIYDQDLTAYNLQIEGIHTYYAGNTPVLVHNMCDPELVYEASPKHGPVARQSPKGEISRAPRGDCQAMLECSTQLGPKLREGIEPDTGLTVLFRRTRAFEGPDGITEWWHGYVPGG